MKRRRYSQFFDQDEDDRESCETLRRDIARSLGIDPDRLPAMLDPTDAAQVLGVSAQTLSIWRCTNRYPLQYVKIGRRVKYRIDDLVRFIESRTQSNV